MGNQHVPVGYPETYAHDRIPITEPGQEIANITGDALNVVLVGPANMTGNSIIGGTGGIPKAAEVYRAMTFPQNSNETNFFTALADGGFVNLLNANRSEW